MALSWCFTVPQGPKKHNIMPCPAKRGHHQQTEPGASTGQENKEGIVLADLAGGRRHAVTGQQYDLQIKAAGVVASHDAFTAAFAGYAVQMGDCRMTGRPAPPQVHVHPPPLSPTSGTVSPYSPAPPHCILLNQSTVSTVPKHLWTPQLHPPCLCIAIMGPCPVKGSLYLCIPHCITSYLCSVPP